MTPPTHDTALDALERARRAQEAHERRIDVQLRLASDRAQLRAERIDRQVEARRTWAAQQPDDAVELDPPEWATWLKGQPCPYCGAAIWSIVRHCYRCPDWPIGLEPEPDTEHLPTADDELIATTAELAELIGRLYDDLTPLGRKLAVDLATSAARVLNVAAREHTRPS